MFQKRRLFTTATSGHKTTMVTEFLLIFLTTTETCIIFILHLGKMD